jgi:hypothetical protein
MKKIDLNVKHVGFFTLIVLVSQFAFASSPAERLQQMVASIKLNFDKVVVCDQYNFETIHMPNETEIITFAYCTDQQNNTLEAYCNVSVKNSPIKWCSKSAKPLDKKSFQWFNANSDWYDKADVFATRAQLCPRDSLINYGNLHLRPELKKSIEESWTTIQGCK